MYSQPFTERVCLYPSTHMQSVVVMAEFALSVGLPRSDLFSLSTTLSLNVYPPHVLAYTTRIHTHARIQGKLKTIHSHNTPAKILSSPSNKTRSGHTVQVMFFPFSHSISSSPDRFCYCLRDLSAFTQCLHGANPGIFALLHLATFCADNKSWSESNTYSHIFRFAPK